MFELSAVVISSYSPVLNLVVAVLRDRLLLSLLVERFVLTLINEDYYYYYYVKAEQANNLFRSR